MLTKSCFLKLNMAKKGSNGLIKPILRMFSSSSNIFDDSNLKIKDPEIYKLVQSEKRRQKHGIILVASENFTSKAVNEVSGSCLTNKYSEGYIGARFYPGCEYIDQIETICQRRALNLFKLHERDWHASVQALSGTTANLAVYNAILKPGDALMGLSGKSGGHFSHGFKNHGGLEAISRKFYKTQHYGVDKDGNIDYDGAYELAQTHKPKLIICGYSVNSRDVDYKRFREIADSVGAYLHLDMAHLSGMIAAGILNDPFEYVDVATTSTHKTLRGPRGGLILCKKHLASKVDESLFPGLQGGPHNHQIGALAVALKEANTDEFREYQRQVQANARALAKGLQELKHTIRNGGTDNHMVIWDLRPQDLDTTFLDKACNFASVTLNPIRVDGSEYPNTVRIGSEASTTRGYNEDNMRDVALYLHQILQITLKLKKQTNSNMADFMQALGEDDGIKRLKAEVEDYADRFEMPGL
jgi:glycine hydroxymethyltransferase